MASKQQVATVNKTKGNSILNRNQKGKKRPAGQNQVSEQVCLRNKARKVDKDVTNSDVTANADNNPLQGIFKDGIALSIEENNDTDFNSDVDPDDLELESEDELEPQQEIQATTSQIDCNQGNVVLNHDASLSVAEKLANNPDLRDLVNQLVEEKLAAAKNAAPQGKGDNQNANATNTPNRG